MSVQCLKEFLDREGVEYETIVHWPTHNGLETAEYLEIAPHALAETVPVRFDGELVLVVFPANDQLDLELVRRAVGAEYAELVGEQESCWCFPHCEDGAVPPFGNLYGVRVLAADDLADSEWIAFNAGSHTEMIRISYADFERLVRPTVARFCTCLCPGLIGL